MVARTAGFKSARREAGAGSVASDDPASRPETQPVPQHVDQVIQLVEQLQQSFHGCAAPVTQRRGVAGAGSGGISPLSLRQDVRTLSAHSL